MGHREQDVAGVTRVIQARHGGLEKSCDAFASLVIAPGFER